MKTPESAHPPFALRFLSWFCPAHLYEEIEGDLIQKFNRDVKVIGEKRAKRKLLWDVIRFFRPGILLRNKFSMELNQSYMYRSYFKIMLRNMIKQKFYSAITMLGLTVGITFALLIGIFVWGELQVNTDLKDVNRLYLMKTNYKTNEGIQPPFFVPSLLGQAAIEQYPTIFENYYRFRDRAITVSKSDKHFRLQSMIGDSTFFDMFGFHVLHGHPQHALNKPNSIVITEKIAQQFFDRTDVTGELLTLSTEVSGSKEHVIIAVIADLQKKNSVTDFMNSDAQIFLPQESRTDFNLGFQDEWNTGIITYLKLTEGASPVEAAAVLNKILQKDAPKDISNNKNIVLDPLSNYYLLTNHGAVQKLIVSLMVIVAFILLLAVTNFINISIASSFSRLKEVGVRKVIGGVKWHVLIQFLSESLLLATVSGTVSLLLYEILHNYFANVLGVSLPSLLKMSFLFWVYFLTGTIAVGLLAGIYPSFYLSSTGAIESLKGKFSSVKGTLRFSRGLVGFQFLVAVFTLITSFVMSRQISYFMETDLGYDKSHVLIASSLPRIWTEEGMNKMDVAKREFLTSPKIKSVSLSWGSPNFNFDPYSANINLAGKPIDQGVLTTMAAADEDYAHVYGMNLLDGKFFFDAGEPFQANQLVLNESAQKELGISVGDKVNIQFSDKEFTIVGIVKDFHFESMHEKIKPVAFTHNRDFQAYRYFSFKLNPGSIVQSVREVERLWKNIFPNDPFVYAFTEDRLAITYQTELQLRKATAFASVLILIIVLTGVLGLVSLSVAKRNKEIGIRKVLGASVSNILALISREYALLMIIAFGLGIPVSYMFISHWLSGFAYRIDVDGWMFVVPILALFCITIVMVCAQSFKTAKSDPVKSLKYE
ncbi:MAG: ABC transporter permease [Cytophagales bacterium]|nr:ABC transporter permease [Cytophagales bacterium]MCA6368112.1 ABC transporter permease [Cytophagales bacterium]MCA6370626.1 ABC transporter permease [Cytophagales bacterium]MCA6375719.1 ABC transporter permease [Cytophagales bacterium]MCA6384112.1 ABC transporter permease [Cytophagales bacterium]